MRQRELVHGVLIIRSGEGEAPIMQGIYVRYERPKSKKAVREAAIADPSTVRLEATSAFGNEYDGPLSDAPDGRYDFVGPDPYTKRDFYGSVTKTGEKITVK